MKPTLFRATFASRGSALLIVLAFLLLLTTLTVAFLSRSTMERQLSNGSFSQGKTDLVVQGSIATIISDLQQEVLAGSTVSAAGYCTPSSPLTMVPYTVGFTHATPPTVDGLENLVKISKSGAALYAGANYNTATYPAPTRASSVNSQANASLNNRAISFVRWNAPLLVTRKTPTSSTDYTPVLAFPAPDWIYVARDGSNPSTWSSSYTYLPTIDPATPTSAATGTNPVTQRYAYAIYDEGSTLDLNVAGCPVRGTAGAPLAVIYTTNSTANGATPPYKNALSYADLTQIPYLSLAAQTVAGGTSTILTAAQQKTFVNAIVGWRNNYSYAASAGKFPGIATAYNFSTTPVVASGLFPADQNIVYNSTGFLSTALYNKSTAVPYQVLSTNTNPNTHNRTDNAFSSRQQLIQFFLQGLGQNSTFTGSNVSVAALINSLQYFGTFSRDISQPSYSPPAGRPVVLSAANGGNSGFGKDSSVNPSLLGVTIPTAPAATVTRNDGTAFALNEPLLKRRFALNRLAWITYKGPTGGGTDLNGNSVAARSTGDADMAALIKAGIPATFLTAGTTTNIKNYFGLEWDSTNNRWVYDWHNNGGTPATNSKGAIMKLGDIAALTTPHDPDFFEILKATIGVGSLAKALANSKSEVSADPTEPAGYNYYVESSVDFQIIQIGANIIDQFQPANYPIQIVFDDGSGQVYVPKTIVGIENLPYLSVVMNGALQLVQPAPLPRSGRNAFAGSNGSGAPGDSGYQSTEVITTSGVGAYMQLPVIWNPHDPSSSTGAIGPKNFRVVADSATPDQIAAGGPFNSFFVYAQSLNVGAGNNYSYGAAASSPGYSWYGDSLMTGQALSHTFQNPSNTTGNAEVDFTLTAGTKTMCPEPMILMRPGTFTDSSGNSVKVGVPQLTALMNVDPVVKPYFNAAAGGLKNILANAPEMQSPESLDAANAAYVGFYLGAFPLAWNTTPVPPATSSAPCSEAQSGAVLAQVVAPAPTPAGSPTTCSMTYRMQFQDPNNANNWITYDTKYGKPYLGNSVGLSADASGANQGGLVGQGDWGYTTDPRTSRFGFMANPANDKLVESGGQGFGLPGPEITQFWSSADAYAAGWIDTANGIMYTARPDGQAGYYCKTGWNSVIGPSQGWMAYIASDTSAGSNHVYSGLVPGLLSQNNTDIYYFPHHFYGDAQGANTQTPNYFADPDGMVRRAMGAFVPIGLSTSPQSQTKSTSDIPSADTTVGLPMARVFNWKTYTPGSPNPSTTVYTGPTQTQSQAQSRPFFLHRPFYSVGELGYVFSDTPWRNIDFFTAESGNAALLDAFCINDTTDSGGLVAGKINLNTRQAPVLQAVLAGGALDPVQVIAAAGATAVGQLDGSTTTSVVPLVAKALVARTTDTANVANGTGPLQNVSELVGKWQKNIAINDLGSTWITGFDQGTLSSITSTTFYDGKLSYSGFSGGVWDTTNHKPLVNGVENFSLSNGASVSTTYPEDLYSAYYTSTSFATAANHNGTRESAAYIQRFREAPIRALAAAGTTRVWNLMIDVIAQTGRFPSSAGNLNSFNVEGERRYWVHVAIDRYTGKVLDEQIEEVKE